MDNKKVNYSAKLFSPRSSVQNPFMPAVRSVSDNRFWRWGDDNLFPVALSLLARQSTTHRRIINDKADYISGKGLTCDEGLPHISSLIKRANPLGDSLRSVLNRLAMDKALFGNAFVEVVTDAGRTFLALFHQDASLCRLSRDGAGVLLHHDWSRPSSGEMKYLPLFPAFAEGEDGKLHSIIHYKDYEPMFSHYGVPPYIAGLGVSTIAYKTDRWNISRLDNSFQLSGVMMLDGGVDNDQQAEELMRSAQRKFAGQPGQVMFMIKDCSEGDSSRFIPITATNEGDWRDLHEQATGDIVVAHSWFRSLSGLDYGNGFNAERIIHEYEVALNTVILGEQAELLEPIKEAIELVWGEDASSLTIINQPPSRSKPLYMKVWEARRADGLEYDPEDPEQQLYVAQVTKYGLQNVG